MALAPGRGDRPDRVNYHSRIFVLLRCHAEGRGAAGRHGAVLWLCCGRQPRARRGLSLVLGTAAAELALARDLHGALRATRRSRLSAPTGGGSARSSQVAVLLFAWLVAEHAAGRPGTRAHDPPRRRRRGRHLRALRHRAVLRLGPASARGGLSHRRRHLDHRAPARHAGLRQLLRHLAAVRELPQPGARAHGESVSRGAGSACGRRALSTVAMLLTGTRAAVLGLVAGAAVRL